MKKRVGGAMSKEELVRELQESYAVLGHPNPATKSLFPGPHRRV